MSNGIQISKSIANNVGTILNARYDTQSGFAPKDWPDAILRMMLMPLKTASGSVATFDDGMANVPCDYIKCNITPNLTGVEGIIFKQAGDDVSEYVTYETDFHRKIYGGIYDIISGELLMTWGYIASYAGETLPGEWISSEDTYAPGTTPTTGAHVAYALAEEDYVTFTYDPQMVRTYQDNNNMWHEDGSIEVSYRNDDVAPSPEVKTKYRYILWIITKTRVTSSAYVDASEIEFRNSGGFAFSWPQDTISTCSTAIDGTSYASNLINGRTNDRWLAKSNTSLDIKSSVLFDLGSDEENWFDPREFNTFNWYFANESASQAARDPISWRLELYNAGDAHKIVAEDNDSEVPHTQAGLAASVTLTIPT